MLAIVVAPLAEEFIFRFFLYGVLKRYLGRGPGLVLNALDQFIFGEWLSRATAPVHLLGALAGAEDVGFLGH